MTNLCALQFRFLVPGVIFSPSGQNSSLRILSRNIFSLFSSLRWESRCPSHPLLMKLHQLQARVSVCIFRLLLFQRTINNATSSKFHNTTCTNKTRYFALRFMSLGLPQYLKCQIRISTILSAILGFHQIFSVPWEIYYFFEKTPLLAFKTLC
jgi:hypothetical protein